MRILLEQKIFNFNFSIPFLETLSLKMKEVIYGPGEIIYRQGEYENPSLYYITKGEIISFLNMGSKNNIQTLNLNTYKEG